MKTTITLFLLFFCLSLTAQDFFRGEFDRNKTYILLANPTAKNIETMEYLTGSNLFKINPRKVHFVGVYHKNQPYDFKEALEYITKKELDNFFLHEVRGLLNENHLFEQNELTDELNLLFENSSGIIFFGGPDIPPSVYGEANTLSVVTDPQRHYFETTFLFHLLGGYRNEAFQPFLDENTNYMVTGFCLGLQTMNVATGGTLIQDIPSEVYGAQSPDEVVQTGTENMHRNYWHKLSDDPQLMGISFHTIRFADHPFFRKKVKAGAQSGPLVYSSHHQAVEKIGKDLKVTAWSSDGTIVEGLAHSRYPHVFAVQFHPEVPALYENREQWKFHPGDQPQTYHQMLDESSLRFHKKYWNHISKVVKNAVR